MALLFLTQPFSEAQRGFFVYVQADRLYTKKGCSCSLNEFADGKSFSRSLAYMPHI